MAVNFPSSPTLGQTFDSGNTRYTFNGYAWDSTGNAADTYFPPGGTAGQALKKNSSANFDMSWQDDNSGTGGISSIVAGNNISIDNTDPDNPVINVLENFVITPQSTKMVYSAATSMTDITTSTTFAGIDCTFRSFITGAGAVIIQRRSEVNTGTATILSTGTSSSGRVSCYMQNPLSASQSYEAFFRISLPSINSDTKIAIGLRGSNTTEMDTNTPSETTKSLILVKDSADTNWFLSTKITGTAVKVDTGLAVSGNEYLDFYIKHVKGDNFVTVDLRDRMFNNVYLNNISVSTNILYTAGSSYYPVVFIMSGSGSTAKQIYAHKLFACIYND